MRSVLTSLFALGQLYTAYTSAVSANKLSTRSILEGTVVSQTPPDSAAMVRIEIALKLDITRTGSPGNELLRLSDPHSEHYGKHWTARDVMERFAPKEEHRSVVLTWLHRSVPASATTLSQSRAGGHVFAYLSVREVEQLLGATCHEYSSVSSSDKDDTWIDCAPYDLSADVVAAIDYIDVSHLRHHNERSTTTNTRAKRAILEEDIVPPGSDWDNRRPVPAAGAPEPPPEFPCDRYTLPSCLRDLYNMPLVDPEATVHPNNTLGIYEQAYQTWLADDLDRFFTRFTPDLIGSRPIVEPIAGGYRQWDFNITPFNLEPSLDFQWAMALSGPQQPVTNIQVGDQFQGGNINTMLAAFDAYYCDAIDPAIDPQYPDALPGGYNKTDCGSVQPPKVLSISFTWAETQFSEAYLQRQCLEILKLGLMGVTVIVSSGDTGTQGGVPPGTCVGGSEGAGFNPTSPAACPWITAVGGTSRSNVSAEDPVAPREQAWSLTTSNGISYTSSGGYSSVFPAPAYQRCALKKYQTLEAEHLGNLSAAGHHHHLAGTNTTGRGFPDISVLAERYLVYLYGQLKVVSGTSASAPVFASMVAMINNERLKAGKGPVGFLNPALYVNGGLFNDVAAGANTGCGADPAYRTAKGWDPVTGLGTPEFSKLRDVLVNLP